MCICMSAAVYVYVTLQFDSCYRVQPNRNCTVVTVIDYTYMSVYTYSERKKEEQNEGDEYIFYVTARVAIVYGGEMKNFNGD